MSAWLGANEAKGMEAEVFWQNVMWQGHVVGRGVACMRPREETGWMLGEARHQLG